MLGAYLIIERLRRSDLGEYVCSISNTEDQVLRQATVLREEGKLPHLYHRVIKSITSPRLICILVLSHRTFTCLKIK